MRKLGYQIALFALLLPISAVDATARKLKKEELIVLHLKAIGENLSRKNRVAQGSGSMDIRVGGQGNLNGRAMLLAEGDKLRTTLTFGHVQYPQETLIRNGDDLDIAYITPGVRSQLGTTIWENFPRLAQEGLYAGVLSTDWALLNLKKKRAKIRYRGLKKFEGRRLHEVDYKPRKKVSYRVRLYFEPETYRHVASRYRLTIPAGVGRGLMNVQQGPVFGAGDGPADNTRIQPTETFSEFKEVDGLALPHHYRITLNESAASGMDSGAGFAARNGFAGHWEIKIDRVSHNYRITPQAFAIK